MDSSLRQGLQHKGTAVTAFVISIALTLYGTTGVLEAARRALNVVFELDGAFAGAIVLLGWLWLTNVALLFGAELDAEIERQKGSARGFPRGRRSTCRRRRGRR